MTETKPRSVAKFSSLAILLLIAAFALLWKLGGASLEAWDEAIYAQVSKEILATGNWLTLHWQGLPWFEKPPLFMWITSLFFRVFGVSEFSARLPSALAGLALIGVVYAIGEVAYNKLVGFLAALVLLTCYHFLSFSRFGTMEILLTVFTYLAVYAYFRTTVGDSRWWYLVWPACALALMTKGAGGLVAPVAILLALLFDRRLTSAIRSRQFWLAFLLGMLIVLPWHALMFARYGREFLSEYIGYHIIARATSTLEGNPSSYLYYLGKLIDGFFPMILLVPFAIVSEIRNRKNEGPRSWILPALAAMVFLFYTLIPTRRPWYIVPLYPALAIIIAGFVGRMVKAYKSRAAYRRIIAIAFVLLLFAGGSYSLASLALNRRVAHPVATLARQAQTSGPDDRAPLILLANKEHYFAQVPLFYSNRPVLQTYVSIRPESHDAKRYVDFKRLADVVNESEQHIIFHKEDVELLTRNYQVRVIAENEGLVYGMIRGEATRNW